jgi:phosphoserine aminotransferase
MHRNQLNFSGGPGALPDTVLGQVRQAVIADARGTPLIADMSSDFMSKPFDVGAYGMVYAHAQKNLGAAGVTVAIIRNALLDRIPDTLPSMLDYRTHIRHRSNFNTPPVFAIDVITFRSARATQPCARTITRTAGQSESQTRGQEWLRATTSTKATRRPPAELSPAVQIR